MKNAIALIAIVLLGCSCVVGQGGATAAESNVMYFQEGAPADPATAAAPPNVLFRTQKVGDKVTTGYFAIADFGKPVTGAPYTATATTETTQVLSDGNRIMNKTESLLARDSQGRTRRQETVSNIGPLATNAPKLAFITDPVAKVNYILDLNERTARVMKAPSGAAVFAGPEPMGGGSHVVIGKEAPAGGATVTFEKKVIVSGGNPGVEQRIWVNSADDPSQVKTESLGTQTIEGVTAEGTRTTHTIPAGQIGNERALEITSEIWKSPELQMIVLSKRYDPRFGETVYRLTDIKRAEPDPSLFQIPGGFSTQGGNE